MDEKYYDGRWDRDPAIACREEIARLRHALNLAQADLDGAHRAVGRAGWLADKITAEANVAPLLLAALHAAYGQIDDAGMSLDGYAKLMRQVDSAMEAAEEAGLAVGGE